MTHNSSPAPERSSSPVSSTDEHNRSEGASGEVSSTVPIASSTPFIGPLNNPALATEQPTTAAPPASNGHDLSDGPANDDVFLAQLEEIDRLISQFTIEEIPIGLLAARNRLEQGIVLEINEFGISETQRNQIEADVMFAKYYYDYDPADGEFPNGAAEMAAAGIVRHSNFAPVPFEDYQEGNDFDYEGEDDDDDDDDENFAEYLFQESHQISRSSIFDRPARPGTGFAGMAIRNPDLPTLIPSVRCFGTFYPGVNMSAAHWRQEGITAPPPTTSAETNDAITAVVRAMQARSASASSTAQTQQATSTTNDATEAPIFPPGWVTHTSTSASINPWYEQVNAHRRQRAWMRDNGYNEHYTIAPIRQTHTEDDNDGDDE